MVWNRSTRHVKRIYVCSRWTAVYKVYVALYYGEVDIDGKRSHVEQKRWSAKKGSGGKSVGCVRETMLNKSKM